MAEVVNDKLRANFCDYFEPGADVHKTGPDPAALRAAADKLFDI